MEEITAGQAIARILEAEGVTTIFGLPGGHILHVYDAILDTPSMRHVLVRHEQCAASLAAGHAQLTGEPGVCTVTAGPGATNLVTGIAEAYVGSLPVIVIAARAGAANIHRGVAQEVDTTRLFESITKWSVRVQRADAIPEILRQAFTVARSGKPGPVFVDIPRDLLPEAVPFGGYRPVGRPAPALGNPDSIAAAAAALATARKPLIVAGGGAIQSRAFDALRELAELLAIPVATSMAGRGALPDDHPLAAGGIGAHRNALTKRLLAEADCVLGLGTRFEEMETNWKPGFVPAPEATYIQVDADGSEIGRSVVPRIGITGDVGLVCAELVRCVRAAGSAVADLAAHPRVHAIAKAVAEIEREADEMAASRERPMHPLTVVRAAREVFPRETTVAIDTGVMAQQLTVFPYFRVYGPIMCCSSFYGMGFASAAAPAAKVVHPDRPALCFVGDGSFQMTMSILPTAVEHRLPLTWIILNDRALGSIRDVQERMFSGRFLGTDFDFQPDFARLAEACGCHGEAVSDPGEVRGALERALAANEAGQPAVLDCSVARERLQHTYEYYAFYSAFPKPEDAEREERARATESRARS